jgi:hypothetical protein
MVLIYIHKSSPRLQYIAAFIFKEIIKTPYAITSHADSFKQFDGIKLNYTEKKICEDELRVPNSGLLFQTVIKEQPIEVFEINSIKAFFRSSSQNNDEYPFDIFSASFYLLTRYEEYLPHKKDNYGRYSYKNSLAFKENFLQIPLINIWVNKFAETLKIRDPKFEFRMPNFKYHPTYDIDIAWSYLHKGFARSTVGGIQAILGLKINTLTQRLKVLSGSKKDPFDNYGWLDELHQLYSLTPIYFFLVAEKNGLYDKNILPTSTAMQQLIKDHAEKYAIGLHPSWRSVDLSLIKKEKETLEQISRVEVLKSRQHYIRFNLPEGYRRLIEAGLSDDYSMGYATSNGFRASVASSHFWYNLEKQEQTTLRIHPFCYMDSTSIFQQKLSAEEAYTEMLYYYNTCKKINGTFISILHNNLLGNDKKKWKDMYGQFLKTIERTDTETQSAGRQFNF